MSKPASSKQQTEGNFTQNEVDKILDSYSGKIKTIYKYSYYESSNGKWVKVLVTIDGIKDVLKENIIVKFSERTCDIFVKDTGPKKDIMLHFGCRRTHKAIVVKDCKWAIKHDGIQLSLKKKDVKDNWWSFYKEKATGEVDSEYEEDVIRQIKK